MHYLLKLFTTSHCHLCELAHELVSQHRDGHELQCVEITDSERLLEAYGPRVPVLQRTDTLTELDWPFDKDDIQRFLET